MAKITIEIPEEMKELPPIYWVLAVRKVIEEHEEKRRKIARIKFIAAKSQAKEEDVEEIVEDIEEGMEKHYSKY